MSYIILDIDNCISDDAWRADKIRWDLEDRQQRYHEYHMLSSFDKYRNWQIVCGHDVVISTCRPQFYEQITRHWLHLRGIKPVMLLMRKNDDHRTSNAVKKEHYEASIGAAPDGLHCVYDDNPAIIAMYRELGIPARQIFINDPKQYERCGHAQDSSRNSG